MSEIIYSCGHTKPSKFPTSFTLSEACPLCAMCREKNVSRTELRLRLTASEVSRFDSEVGTSALYSWDCQVGHKSYSQTIQGILAGHECKACWHESNTGTVKPGIAFSVSDLRPHTSKAERDLRKRLALRIRVPGEANAVKVSTRVFGRLEVWPDIILPKLKIAIEYDDPGRGGEAHRGKQETTDRQKDAALREVGWEVVRVRVGGLKMIGPWDIVAAGVSNSIVEAVIQQIVQIRGKEAVTEQLLYSAGSFVSRAGMKK